MPQLARDLLIPHRNYVAHNANFDSGLTVFQVLLDQGLRSTDVLCDVGCGSLRVGRYLLTHLEHGHYYGIEPNEWLINAAIDKEVGTLPRVKNWHIASGASYSDFNIANAFPQALFDWVLISSVLTHASHAQMRQALTNAMMVSSKVLFDTIPTGSGAPDNTDEWQYPQVANHDDVCVLAAIEGLTTKLTKLHLGTFGEQWWRLDYA